MFRTFTLPTTVAYASIWDLIVSNGFCDSRGITATDKIIPDRVRMLDVRPADVNTDNVTYRDRQADPGVEQQLTNMSKHDGMNSICLRDYQFADPTLGDAIVVEIESV